MVSVGGRYEVDAEPEPEPELVALIPDRIVLIEPVGERVIERSGGPIERSRASLVYKLLVWLHTYKENKR